MPTFYPTIRDVEVDLEIDDIVAHCDTDELLDEINSTDRQALLDWIKENYPTPEAPAAPALTDEQVAAINRAAFILETVAHLSRLEREILPAAQNLRSITQPTEETV